ncbi:LOW QUALITY PROTEIN: hypothetical protein RJ640_027928 [Escallonia rubra]|uniref:Protein kinase domain-containing protein n=1 Tax=Escallonia rubra TaxID=112253 RepID=A0AA88UG50_9ASTE|nr:LOW QUALITY PROTEIN: hypothetical protein RJ640_027928 [Escallonia rubra]
MSSLELNPLNGTLPVSIGNLSSSPENICSWLRNQGTIPNEIGNLSSLTYLSLLANDLIGAIPMTVKGMRRLIKSQATSQAPMGNLVEFSLAHKRSEGLIPDTLESLTSLEILDLSHNNPSGMIRKSMIKLSNLIYFNVFFNSLSGEIPTSGPFQNFTSQSFVLNEALCGATRFGVLPCITRMVTRSKTRRKVVLICVFSAVSLVVLVMTLVCELTRHRKVRELNMNWIFSLQHYIEESVTMNFLGVLSDGIVVAIKVFRLNQEKALKSFETECEVIRNIRHRNLTKVITSCSNLDFRAVVLEYMPNGSLEKWLYSHNYYLDIMQRLNIMIDVTCALDYLHFGFKTPVVHCDLKPSNLLLNEDMIGHQEQAKSTIPDLEAMEVI